MLRPSISLLLSCALLTIACNNSPTSPDPSCQGLPVAPNDQRVDLTQPTRFSDPTAVDNPLFPISALDRVLLFGNSDGQVLRVETTLLPYTRTIDLNGQPVETLVSQYVAWKDGRIAEAALDWYAQDDDGAVWYFGEDVNNYDAGIIADNDGTWLTGRDGLVAMIMPSAPLVGDVWRPENICGLVFEEVTVTATGVTVDGPRGPVQGALVTNQLYQSGLREDKIFAPAYGEFSTGAVGADLEAVGLAIPTDAVAGALPGELTTLSAGSDTIFDAAQARAWGTASAVLGPMNTAWTSFQSAGVPPTLRANMNAALAALGAAVQAQSVAGARQGAVDVDLASLDLQLRHRPRREVDLQLLERWARQLVIDVEAGDQGAALGDAASLKWIRERFAVDATPEAVVIDTELARLGAAVQLRDGESARRAVGRLQRAIRE